jgi:hypothetical protein
MVVATAQARLLQEEEGSIQREFINVKNECLYDAMIMKLR